MRSGSQRATTEGDDAQSISVAMARNPPKPTMSVIMVMKMFEATAGS